MIRSFTDADGRVWDVVTGRESWGVMVAIFVPADGGEDLRQTPLRASGYDEANAELEALDLKGLQDLLARGGPKT